MLSLIVRIASRFELEHGRHPTLLTLNPAHFNKLRDQLGGQTGLDFFCARLGMHIVLSSKTVHPAVCAVDTHSAVHFPEHTMPGVRPPIRIG